MREEYHLAIVIGTFAALIGVGTVVFHMLEPFTWIQAFYFSVSTMTTVGYGDLVPSNDMTRLVVSIYMLVSVTLYISLATHLGKYYLDRHPTRRRER